MRVFQPSPPRLSQNQNGRFLLFQYTNVYLYAKFDDLKPTIDEKRRPHFWTCLWARLRNNIPQGNFDFISTKYFINVNRSSCSKDCATENPKPRDMLRDQPGDQPSKNWEIPGSISRAIRLGFLRSLVSPIRCEANKSFRRREERPIGSLAVKMFRDLLRRARGLAQHVEAANARAEVRARMHNWSTWYQGSSHNRLRDGSLENATCARGTDRAKLNARRGNLHS